MASSSTGEGSGGVPEVDVLIAGGGNAAMCAAIMARHGGAGVLVLEAAPKAFRGGNSRHTRNLRYMHEGEDGFLTGTYPEDEFYEDLLRVTGGATNEELARFCIRESQDAGEWMSAHGIKWQPSLRGTLQLSRTNAFFLGGGKALVNAYYDTAEKMGIQAEYDTEVRDLNIEDGVFRSAVVEHKGQTREVAAKAFIGASGGFEANVPWLKEYWGDAADNFIIRGTPYNKGRVLRQLFDAGAKPAGRAKGFHAIALDGRAPKFDGGIVTRLDCVPFGVVLNKNAERFYDEGEDFWPKRYAIWGTLIAGQPEQEAYCFVDAKSIDLFLPSVFPPFQADSVRQLAAALDLNPAKAEETVNAFNASVKPGAFDPTILDDCSTEGMDPPKSHWARPIDTPPFYGYPLRPGITFTYMGVAVNKQCQVLFGEDRPSPNIFAAGEMMSGNILGKGYLAGFGMTIGTVFGRIAGREAARAIG